MRQANKFVARLRIQQVKQLNASAGSSAVALCCFTPRMRRRMERRMGFEPTTSTLARSHSTTELPPRFYFFGARTKNRTWNLDIKSVLLCQLSYAGAVVFFRRPVPPKPCLPINIHRRRRTGVTMSNEIERNYSKIHTYTQE